MSRDLPRAQMDVAGATFRDDHEASIAPHSAVIPGCGMVRVDPCSAFSVVTIDADNVGDRIAMILARRPCQCGCGEKIGRGLSAPFSPDGARELAAQLNALADKLEGAAATAAAEALRKAAGK